MFVLNKDFQRKYSIFQQLETNTRKYHCNLIGNFGNVT